MPSEIMPGLIIDMETRSAADLPRVGAHNYARDPTTEIICVCFKAYGPDGPMWTWRNPALFHCVNDWPPWLTLCLGHAQTKLFAHYAEFEMNMWEFVAEPEYDFPEVDYNRWVCSSALARLNALPGGLDDAAHASGSPKRKDYRGAQLIRQLCIPGPDGTFNEDRTLLEEMVEYCAQDVRATEALIHRCRGFTEQEHADYLLTVDINERGIRIDRELAWRAQSLATAEATSIARHLAALTDGRITKHTQTRRISDWVRRQLEDEKIPTTVMHRYKDGKKRYSVDKSVRAEMLDRADELDLPDHVIDVLKLTDEGNRSSVAKFEKMRFLASPEDDRVRGAFLYAGAGQTQRFSSVGLQLHNMRRDALSVEETAELLTALRQGQPVDSVMDTLSRALRPALVPSEGKVFVVGDWSSIEAMALPWLADTPSAHTRLRLHADPDVDVYELTAEEMGLKGRQVGKVAELSLGYGGAEGAFRAMARNFGLDISGLNLPLVVGKWRIINEWAPQFWRELERAARNAMQSPGATFCAGHVTYRYMPNLLGGTLQCLLPGNVVIQYPFARLEMVDTPFGRKRAITAIKASWKPSADAKEWPRFTLWYGLLAENATQAFCAGILRAALRRLGNKGPGDIVAHTHDEIVLEVLREMAYAAQKRLSDAMNTRFRFAPDLPLRTKPKIMSRYGK